MGNDSKFGCINESGDEVIPLEYDTLYRCGTNRFIFEKNGKFGLMDKNCNVIIKNEFDYLRPVINGEVDESAPDSAKQDSDIFVSGIYCAKLNGKAGIVDAKGEILLPFEYKYDVAPVIENGRTLIPIRSLENLGCTVAWNSSGYRVFVAY